MDQHKKPIPTLPKHIGVITSPTGAAIRDILSVLKRRFPSIPITLFPTRVQGTEAAAEIVRALALSHQFGHCDVLILARGGGSLEDLWPFNEESVARAIFNCEIPIVSGVGHEIDFTIADFVADKRAPTPSAAAELVSPNQQEWLQRFRLHATRLQNTIIKLLEFSAQKVDYLSKRLRHPGQQIQLQLERLASLQKRFDVCCQRIMKEKSLKLDNLFKALKMVSPLATLGRGYSIVAKSTGKILRSTSELDLNEKLEVTLADGKFSALPCE